MERYLYRAPYVVPVATPLIEDGGMLTEDGRIVAVGRFSDLQGTNAKVVDYDGHILTPALINGHAHLELSYLAHLGQDLSQAASGDIVAWIRKLLQAREQENVAEDEQEFLAWQALAQLYASGCTVVADIGNNPGSQTIGKDFKVRVLFFLEMLGLSKQAENEALERIKNSPSEMRCTAHAPYSTGPELMLHLKDRARRHNHIFPLHVAESVDEIDLLQTGSGRFKGFLQYRGGWDDSFVPPGTGAVSYLDKLDILDEKTLCVHAVHINEEEIDILAQCQAKVCLCPGSNRYMGVGKPPVGKFLVKGIRPALGTDSLASNTMLNMWREMRLLLEDHPNLDPEEVFKMATINGAAALGVADQVGTLESGKSSAFLAVCNQASQKNEIYEFLTSVGEDVQMEWAE